MSRSICSNCHYLMSRCLCSQLVLLESPIPIIILQSKSETKHALNTVKILRLNLKNIKILEIDEDQFTNEAEIITELANYQNPVLIFPTEKANDLKSIPNESKKKIDLLIFIDGSWKKSKKIFFIFHTLHLIQSIKLSSEENSKYTIRQSSMPHSLSTIEAVTYVLNNVIEDKKYDDLLRPFQKMIEMQMSNMSEEVQKRYKKKEH